MIGVLMKQGYSWWVMVTVLGTVGAIVVESWRQPLPVGATSVLELSQIPTTPSTTNPVNPSNAMPTQTVPTQVNPAGLGSTTPTTSPTGTTTTGTTAPIYLFDEEYRLGAGDVVQIKFFNVPEYNGEYQISPDGKVNLPLVGRVSLDGLDVDAAGDRLSKAYAKELRYPEITVILTRRRPLQIVMRGEITQPGLYVFPSDNNGQPPRLFQALQTAGGVTQSADLSQVQVIRNDPATNLPHAMTANVLALLTDGDLSQNVDLRDEDVIYIPPVAVLDVDILQNVATSNLRSQSTVAVDVSLIGEVGVPGPYRFTSSEQATLIRAIQGAGGLSPFADIRNITLERRARDGSTRQITVDLFAILDTGDRRQDVLLQTGDVINIPKTQLSNDDIAAIASSTLSSGPINIALLGEVKTPGTQQVPANTSLNQAILAAGGLNDLARSEVKLLRFNPDGSVTERHIKVDLNQTINAETNPILRRHDIIMVGKSTWGSIKDTLGKLTNNLNFFLPFLFFRN